MKITKYSKLGKIRSCNDNRHDPFLWDLIHRWLYLWFIKNDIPQTYENFNRAVHYNYEFVNRPWLSSRQNNADALYWLENEAKRLGVITVEIKRSDLTPYVY